MKKYIIFLIIALPFFINAQQKSSKCLKNHYILSAQISGPTTVCSDDTVEYVCSLQDTNLIYNWSTANGDIIYSKYNIIKAIWWFAGGFPDYTPGFLKVVVFSNNNIKIDSAFIEIHIGDTPRKPTIFYDEHLLKILGYDPDNPNGPIRMCDWYLNGKQILYENHCKINPIIYGFGSYQVRMTSRQGCKSELSEPFLFTDIAEFDNKSVSISPNPAKDYIEISHVIPAEAGIFKDNIKIYNMLGQNVLNQSYKALTISKERGMYRIDISELVPGVYILRFGNLVKRFIKY